MKLFMIQLCGLFNKLDNYDYLFCIIIYLPINSVIFYMGYLPDLALEYFINNKALTKLLNIQSNYKLNEAFKIIFEKVFWKNLF